MTRRSLLIAATSCFIGFAPAAHARSAYDGPWDLAFVTQRGTCDSSYSFTVDVTNGIISHPNLVRFRGYVANSGSVRALAIALRTDDGQRWRFPRAIPRGISI